MKQDVAPVRGRTPRGFVKLHGPQAPPAEVRQSPTLRARAPQAATRISAFFSHFGFAADASSNFVCFCARFSYLWLR
ncbi:hypothetical protein, partial [uncultured Alistipes sp.]|uniref:hypothetical protein n=1 Tax=uncultured Alistipes sp. TaxID=538949 RepID=UPI002616BCCC